MLERPLTLTSGVVLSNRIAKAAMTEAMCPEGDPTRELVSLYRTWASHGPGLLITGNAMVDRRYLERIGNLVLDGRTDRAAVRRLAEAVAGEGVALYAQLSHPGRQTNAFVHPRPVAPSAVPAVAVMKAFGKPRALTEAEVEEIAARFVGAASLAKEAGFSGVQIHGAHGYLVSQFLSPLTNQRTDAWGGDAERRARFLLELVRRVRQKVGAGFGIAVKLNSADFQKGGFDEGESLQVIEKLDREGLDFLEISGGNYESVALLGYGEDGQPRRSPREAYFLDFAEKARGRCRMPLMLTGGLRSRTVMEGALGSGAVDLIGIGRPFCVQPDLPRALLGSPDAVARPFTIPKLGVPAMEGQAETDWCDAQMRRIAQGAPPDLSLGVRARTGAILVRDAARATFRRWSGRGEGPPA